MRKVRIIETGEEFKSLSECARYIDGNVENVYKCLAGRCRSYLGFTFEYVDKNVPYLKLGKAIKVSLCQPEIFDEVKFAQEMHKTKNK